MERRFVLAVVFLLIVLAFLSIYKKPETESLVKFYSEGKNVTLKVKVADTEESRNKGLMFVEKLGENEGILFVYNDEQKRTFWMKNTLIPLDMIFVAANGTVVSVIENAEPCKKDPCEIYSVDAPSRYVVEVNAGFAKENGISAYDFAELK